MKTKLFGQTAMAALGVALVSAATPAFAQGADDAAINTDNLIIVTGSFIRGTPEDAALPVDVYSSDDLSQAGINSPLDFIKDLPSVGSVLGDTNAFSTAAQGFQGAGSINLRGLGPTRTLVLLNGRRTIVHPGAGFVDTNLMPLFALDRVEILKDGAAATYGSDAIGGVANFVTRQGFEGVELVADYEFINGSDDDYTGSILVGHNFGDSANLLIGFGYQHRSQLSSTERDYTQVPYAVNPAGYSAVGNPGIYSVISNMFGVVSAPVLDGSGIDTCGATGGQNGVLPLSGTFAAPICRYTFVPSFNLVEEQDRYQLFGQFDVDLADNLSFHLEGMWARTEQLQDRFSPAFPATQGPNGSGTINAFTVPRSNPGFEAFIQQTTSINLFDAVPTPVPLAGSAADLFGDFAAILLTRPFALGGNPVTGGRGGLLGQRVNDAWRFSGGFEWEISDNFRVSTYGTFFRSERVEFLSDILGERLQLALNGLGGPNCMGATPGANGCLYLNPFSNSFAVNPANGLANPGYVPGNENGAAIVNWVQQDNGQVESEEQFIYDLIFSGESGIDLGGGAIAYAFGFQYRDTLFESRPINDFSNADVFPCPLLSDPVTCLATPGADIGPFIFLGQARPASLSQSVYALFAEVNIPIGDTLEITGAIRYEDYGGTVGSTINPKGSIRWEPADWLVLRGSVGTTFRGPLPSQVSPNAVTSLAGIQAAGNNFRSVDIFGNPTDLGPETAFTYNMGAIVDYAGFTFSIDYWSYDFEDRITTTPAQSIANTVAGTPGGGNGSALVDCTNPLADLITFQGGCVQGVTTAGTIARIRTDWVNGPGVQTSGLDFSADWTGDLGPGVFSIGGQATYILDYDVDDFIFRGVLLQGGYSAAGFANFFRDPGTVAEWRANGYINYNVSGLNVRYSIQYIDGVTDDRCVGNDPCVTTEFGGSNFGAFVESYTQHDINIVYDMPLQFMDAQLQFGIENFTNTDPSAARLELGYNPFIGNPVGRVYRVGMRVGF